MSWAERFLVTAGPGAQRDIRVILDWRELLEHCLLEYHPLPIKELAARLLAERVVCQAVERLKDAHHEESVRRQLLGTAFLSHYGNYGSHSRRYWNKLRCHSGRQTVPPGAIDFRLPCRHRPPSNATDQRGAELVQGTEAARIGERIAVRAGVSIRTRCRSFRDERQTLRNGTRRRVLRG